MRVLFECEQGHKLQWHVTWEQPSGRSPLTDAEARKGVFVVGPCPVCHPPQAQYGPITEEMVAGMLRMVDADITAHCYPQKDYVNQARAVIRLLEYLYPYKAELSYCPDNRFRPGYDWRDKLLELARET